MRATPPPGVSRRRHLFGGPATARPAEDAAPRVARRPRRVARAGAPTRRKSAPRTGGEN
jgi:hypothetical protein